jgi:phosphoribosylformimino-5-aminoimidazole carboxamide ribotide isomerase
MILLPAVDIRHGRAVNLRQGHFDEETVYAADPLAAARTFYEQGARYLHAVDLDGALEGRPVNLGWLERMASELDLPVQYGGGLRSLPDVSRALAAGAAHVVIGTAAYTDPAFLSDAVREHGSRVCVGVDVRGGRVSVAGWTRETEMLPEELIERLQRHGVERFVCTDADLDGMLGGVDMDATRRISQVVNGEFIVSGGVSTLADLRALRDLDLPNLTGVISGKALYERRFSIADAQAVLDAPAGEPG